MFLLFIDREATPLRQIIDLLATDNYDISLSLVQYLDLYVFIQFVFLLTDNWDEHSTIWRSFNSPRSMY